MATIAVPQKKKGDTRDAHSQSSLPAGDEAETAASSPSLFPSSLDAPGAGERVGRRGLAASSAPASTKHSTSELVPTQSSESAGAAGGEGAEGGEDSRRARTAATAGRRAWARA